MTNPWGGLGLEGEVTLMKQGAEAKLFQGTFLGRKCVLKERFVKSYRHPALDERLTKDRMRGELRGLVRSRSIGIRTPVIYFVDPIRNAIVMEYVEGAETANVFIGKLMKEQEDVRLKRLHELAELIGKAVAKMHGSGIIHGDLTTSNLLVKQDKSAGQLSLCLIDFGLSHVENSPEDKGVDLYVLERALTSTFSSIPWFFEELLTVYRRTYVQGGEEVFQKLEEVRLRGRKRTMVG